MRSAAFYGLCAALGILLGYAATAAVCAALDGQQAAVWLPSGREATDFVADVEGWLRGEGY